MSDQSHYAKLGLDESATFEEVQQAKERLLTELVGDRKQAEAVEAAYDAILMERLRQRQEGKIKVPDRIRFPERLAAPPPDTSPEPSKAMSVNWARQLLDTPSRTDVLWPGVLFVGLSALSLTAPPIALALGVAASLYFLNRKEHKFGRAFLLTLVGLIVGVVAGLWLSDLFQPQLVAVNLQPDTFAAIVAFLVLWLISSFLR